MGGSPGLVVMGVDSRSKVVGSNPGAGYWMDMTFFTGTVVNMFILFK